MRPKQSKFACRIEICEVLRKQKSPSFFILALAIKAQEVIESEA
jgi:hypothetical protein